MEGESLRIYVNWRSKGWESTSLVAQKGLNSDHLWPELEAAVGAVAGWVRTHNDTVTDWAYRFDRDFCLRPPRRHRASRQEQYLVAGCSPRDGSLTGLGTSDIEGTDS